MPRSTHPELLARERSEPSDVVLLTTYEAHRFQRTPEAVEACKRLGDRLKVVHEIRTDSLSYRWHEDDQSPVRIKLGASTPPTGSGTVRHPRVFHLAKPRSIPAPY